MDTRKDHSRRILGMLAGMAVAVMLPSAIAIAATTDSVTLSGTVSSTLSIVATDTAAATALDLTTASEQIVKVSDLAMSTNNSAGLTLTASSGNLTNPDSQTIAFKVTSVDDAATAPTSGAFTVASGTDYTVAGSAAGDFDKDLYIAYTPAALQDPGSYSGTISLTVADN